MIPQTHVSKYCKYGLILTKHVRACPIAMPTYLVGETTIEGLTKVQAIYIF